MTTLLMLLLYMYPVSAQNSCEELFSENKLVFPILQRLTPEQIYSAIQFLYSQKHPLQSGFIQKDRNNSHINTLLSQHMGFAVTPGKIFDHAHKSMPVSWLWWLRQAGVPEEELNHRWSRTQHLSIEEAKAGVFLLRDNGVSVFASDIKNMRQHNELLSQLFGRSVAPAEIYLDVRRIHKVAWNNFLQQIGLSEYQELKKPNVVNYLTFSQIINAIQFLYSQRHPLQSGFIQKDRNNSHINTLLSQHMGFAVTPGKIFDHAREIMPVSWVWWLRQAGVPQEKINYRWSRNRHLSLKEAEEAIFLLSQNGVSVFASDIIKMREPNAHLSDFYGRSVAPSEIYLDVVRFHKVSWEKFLRDIGLAARLVRKPFLRTEHLTPAQIVQALKALDQKGFLIDKISFQKNKEVIKELSELFPFPISWAKIYRDAVRFHQTPWEWWLKRAGRRSRTQIFISVRQIIEVIHFLSSLDKYPLNIRALERDRGDVVVNAKIVLITGYPLTPLKIYDQAVRVHDKEWSWWLKKAGLDPQLIYYSMHRYQLSPVEQQEAASNYNAMFANSTGVTFSEDGQVTSVPLDEDSGEVLLLRNEYSTRFEEVKRHMNERELLLVDGLVEYFSYASEFDISTIQNHFAVEYFFEVSQDEVLSLFTRLRNDPYLQALFFDDQ